MTNAVGNQWRYRCRSGRFIGRLTVRLAAMELALLILTRLPSYSISNVAVWSALLVTFLFCFGAFKDLEYALFFEITATPSGMTYSMLHGYGLQRLEAPWSDVSIVSSNRSATKLCVGNRRISIPAIIPNYDGLTAYIRAHADMA